MKIVRSAASASGKYLTLDAVDIYGTIAAPPTRYQQADSHIVKDGVWTNFTKRAASGGTYGRHEHAATATATITFNGTRLDWIGMKGTTAGTVEVYLDGARPAATINLNAATAIYNRCSGPPGRSRTAITPCASCSTGYGTDSVPDPRCGGYLGAIGLRRSSGRRAGAPSHRWRRCAGREDSPDSSRGIHQATGR